MCVCVCVCEREKESEREREREKERGILLGSTVHRPEEMTADMRCCMESNATGVMVTL